MNVYVVRKGTTEYWDDFGERRDEVAGVFSSYEAAWKYLVGMEFRWDRNRRDFLEDDEDGSDVVILHMYSKDGQVFKLSHTFDDWTIVPFELDRCEDLKCAGVHFTSTYEDENDYGFSDALRGARDSVAEIESAVGWCDENGERVGNVSIPREAAYGWIAPIRKVLELIGCGEDNEEADEE